MLKPVLLRASSHCRPLTSLTTGYARCAQHLSLTINRATDDVQPAINTAAVSHTCAAGQVLPYASLPLESPHVAHPVLSSVTSRARALQTCLQLAGQPSSRRQLTREVDARVTPPPCGSVVNQRARQIQIRFSRQCVSKAASSST